MSDHLVLSVDRLARPVPVDPVAQPPQLPSDTPPSPPQSQAEGAVAGTSESAPPVNHDDEAESENGEGGDEEEPLIQMAECRICQEEDGVSNLESPCACSGSLKYAHRKCVQHWCNEKGDITCEICHQPYQSGYTAPPPRLNPDETTIDIGGWTISGTPLDLRDPRLLAIAEAERQFLDAEYDEYAASNASGAAFCRSAFLILMALLILRHALSVTDGDTSDDDPSNFFSLFLLRAAGFLLPCYIMAWAISVLQRRRQRQEAAALAATQVAFVLQSGQRRGLQFGIPPGPTVHPEQA
ncbi:hypothetical protein TanjilG_06737 [Lupinus angustifolius]|uniref:RING-CH-type domain-containing protein n=1 Tax=Lupinus angustifolius TaxID=3871 RepID=A0A1J7GNW2_LUPAN|nr:PREDICTED: uncharacterized protein LOC109359054 [Lupinus angustifolius]OIW02142.1 hypothetical protein TanjilG_06737 [Lupinus angustifolius]